MQPIKTVMEPASTSAGKRTTFHEGNHTFSQT